MTADDTGGEPDPGSPMSTPRWVKVSAAIIIVVLVAFVILHFTCGGLRDHTPA